MTQTGVSGMLECLANMMHEADRSHEWFEIRKMQIRHELHLPLLYSEQSDVITDEQRRDLEDRLLAACQELGSRLLEQGRLREAWNYLRPLGVTDDVRERVRNIQATDDNYEQLVELCFYEGLDIRRGFQLLLDRFGTCNAITTLHAHARQLNCVDRDELASLLVDHLYDELTESVVAHIKKKTQNELEPQRLGDLLQQHEWLFEERAYHIDTSHLSSTVQLARGCRNETAWNKASELTEYGRRLDKSLQYPCEPPFDDTYVAHGHFFSALLNVQRTQGLTYFEHLARTADVYQQTTLAVEVYVDLLARIGQADEALQVFLELVPPNTPTTGLVVSPLHLAEQSGNFTPLLEHYRVQDRLVEYGAALALANQRNHVKTL